ncbi:autoinducer binding domain-containing protein [Mesorhizobium sp. M1423]
MDEATQLSTCCGFTIPIHHSGGLFAALTFASDERRPLFFRVIERYERALELMAIFFHLHARRKLADCRVVDGVALSRREIEGLKWWLAAKQRGRSVRSACAKAQDSKRSKCAAMRSRLTSVVIAQHQDT